MISVVTSENQHEYSIDLQVIDKASIVDTMKKANSILPHVVLASTILALLYPPSFTWFTSRFLPLELGQIDLRLWIVDMRFSKKLFFTLLFF